MQTITTCKQPSDDKKREGFTLVEIMIASAVTAVALIGIYSAMIMFHTMIISTRCHEEAETMAMDRIWSTFNMDFEQLRNLTPNPTVEEVPETSIIYPLGGTIRTAVLNEPNACEILVSVNWQQVSLGGSMRPLQQTMFIRRTNTRR